MLDVTSTTEELGKEAAHDQDTEKMTWVRMLGVKQANELAREHTEQALRMIKEIGGDNHFLLKLAEHMLRRKN